LQNFVRVNQVLQNKDVKFITSAGLYILLDYHRSTSCDEFERYKAATNENLRNIDYQASRTLKRIKKGLSVFYQSLKAEQRIVTL
jgi:hypothetical protein